MSYLISFISGISICAIILCFMVLIFKSAQDEKKSLIPGIILISLAVCIVHLPVDGINSNYYVPLASNSRGSQLQYVFQVKDWLTLFKFTTEIQVKVELYGSKIINFIAFITGIFLFLFALLSYFFNILKEKLLRISIYFLLPVAIMDLLIIYFLSSSTDFSHDDLISLFNSTILPSIEPSQIILSVELSSEPPYYVYFFDGLERKFIILSQIFLWFPLFCKRKKYLGKLESLLKNITKISLIAFLSWGIVTAFYLIEFIFDSNPKVLLPFFAPLILLFFFHFAIKQEKQLNGYSIVTGLASIICIIIVMF